MKRSRAPDCADSSADELDGDGDLDPLAAALLALGGYNPGRLPAQPTAEHEEARLARGPSHSGGLPAGRRGYVWRGPHRHELSQHKQQQPQQLDALLSSAAELHNCSSHRSSATYGLPSDDDEVAQQQQQKQQKQQHQNQQQPKPRSQQQQQQQPKPRSQPRDEPSAGKDTSKEWAALTTWLRMNLHNPRTSKRVVLFVGEYDDEAGCWTFDLNPAVTWSDVSMETKLRLKTLMVEAEQAFAAKYPGRAVRDWGSKVQRYRPPGSTASVDVRLLDVVTSLHQIFLVHEYGAVPSTSPIKPRVQPQAPLQQQQQH